MDICICESAMEKEIYLVCHWIADKMTQHLAVGCGRKKLRVRVFYLMEQIADIMVVWLVKI